MERREWLAQTGLTLMATRLAQAAGPLPPGGSENRTRLNPWRLQDADLRSYMLLGVRHVFKRFRLHKIYLRVLWYNTAAIRCYERCGFRKEGRLREEMCVEGVWHDLIYMGVLRSEFHMPASDGAARG